MLGDVDGCVGDSARGDITGAFGVWVMQTEHKILHNYIRVTYAYKRSARF